LLNNCRTQQFSCLVNNTATNISRLSPVGGLLPLFLCCLAVGTDNGVGEHCLQTGQCLFVKEDPGLGEPVFGQLLIERFSLSIIGFSIASSFFGEKGTYLFKLF
jgi:hypothetical protein